MPPIRYVIVDQSSPVAICSRLIQLLFDFFLPQLQVLYILQKGETGSQRSLIRKIAFKLPIKPLPRVHFTIVNPEYTTSFDWDTNSIEADEGLAAIPILDNRGKIEFWK